MSINKIALTLLLTGNLFAEQAQALSLVAVAKEDADSTVKFDYKTINKKATISNTYLSDEAISLTYTITVAPKDIGESGQLYLVARFNNRYFQLTPAGTWQAWDGEIATLNSFSTKVLAKQETIQVLKSQALPAGEYLVFSGYHKSNLAKSDNIDDKLYYNATPASLAIFDKQSPGLHRISQKTVLTELFERGGASASSSHLITNLSFSPFPDVAGFLPAAATSTTTDAISATSQTNIQELGVDESDRIKVNNDQLFTLENCKSDNALQCLVSHKLIEAPAANTALGKLELGKNLYQGTLYTAQTTANSTQKQIVYLGSSFQYSVFDSWFSPYYWQSDNSTTLKFIDITQPGSMLVKSSITLNAALISSRVVNNVLYLVTRKNPHFYYPQSVEPIVLGEPASPLANAEAPDIVQVPPPKQPTPVKKDIDDLLPTIAFDNQAAKPLVQATDCFVPAQSSDKRVDNTLVTITAIPLTAPSTYYSVCVAGSVDTFYMSTQALYLASTRYPWQLTGNSLTYDSSKEVNTEIHKFKLDKAALTYSGSGVVPGHLGWEADKQPFRMGEYNDVLKVATSRGDTWTNNSTTRVTVLKEDSASKQLKEISALDNLGKPGERLYAARFIQNRGYLVTFKTTDPLYVLDFKDPARPEVIGELMVNGYSDYLHPLGDNYLIGIGKDAIPDTLSPANTGIAGPSDRGAWYQGVKLALYDVSSKQNLREIENMLIGKRGTDSAALSDHHALAWLPTGVNKGTLSIPIELHNNLLPASQLQYSPKDYYSFPYANYDWTHTGLYTFTIDAAANPAIKLSRRLIADIPSATNYNQYLSGRYSYNDRAVIQGNSVHYVHDGRVISADLASK